MFLAESLDICDPVLAFDEIMEEIGIEQYLAHHHDEKLLSLLAPDYQW